MAAPTKPANVKKALANSEPSTHGTSRRFAAPQNSVAIGGKADMARICQACQLMIDSVEKVESSESLKFCPNTKDIFGQI
jgi:hypothetical protein